MKRTGITAHSLGLALAGLGIGGGIGGGIGAAQAQPSVGVSINIQQPGVYGRINIGNVAPPPVVYVQPVIIVPGPVAVQRTPIYFYVPAAQQQNWSRYCGRYGACGQPVYFVQERWVRERWVSEHHQRAYEPERLREGHDNGRHRGWDKHRDRDESGRDGDYGKKGKKDKKGKHDD